MAEQAQPKDKSKVWCRNTKKGIRRLLYRSIAEEPWAKEEGWVIEDPKLEEAAIRRKMEEAQRELEELAERKKKSKDKGSEKEPKKEEVAETKEVPENTPPKSEEKPEEAAEEGEPKEIDLSGKSRKELYETVKEIAKEKGVSYPKWAQSKDEDFVDFIKENS